MVGASITPWPINNKKLIAREIAWWVDPGKRGNGAALSLLRGFKNWAIGCGASGMILASMNNLNGNGLASLYKRLGFTPVEEAYVMSLGE